MQSRLTTMFMGSVIATLGLAAPALASTIPFTSASTLALYDNPLYNPNLQPGDPGYAPLFLSTGYNPQVHSAPPSPASQTTDLSGNWGSVSILASANLQSGQLKARTQNIGDDNLTFGTYAQSNATFGDGFRASTPSGSPFAWQPNSTANFSLNLDGNLDGTFDLAAAGSPSVFVVLNILRAGTLDPAAFTSTTYNINTDPNVLDTFVYVIGNPAFGLYFNGQPVATTQSFTDLPSQISQNFTPGEDFDWWLLLGAAGQVPAGHSYDLDLAHTLTLNYAGPAGTTTTSTSGLFQNFEPTQVAEVPEPGTLVLFGTGLVLAAARLRKKRT